MREPLFSIDNETYDVEVVALSREFVISYAMPGVKTMDGVYHAEPIGSHCHYTMTVRCRRDPMELERFWEKISQPVDSMTCVFPYGQSVLGQEMYVQSGSQALLDTNGGNRWDSITVRFLGTLPRVVR